MTSERLRDEFAFPSGLDRDYLIVERPIETHPRIMGEEQTRAGRLVVPPSFEDLVQDELLSALECARVSLGGAL